MKRFILLIVIIMCVVLTGCQTVEKEERIDVIATVLDMEYQDKMNVPVCNGETIYYIEVDQIPRYLVTISYKGVSKTFDDRNLYENVKEVDTIQMVLYKGYDKDDNLIRQTLLFPE